MLAHFLHFEADLVFLEVNCGLSWIVIKLHAPLFHDARNLRPNVRAIGRHAFVPSPLSELLAVFVARATPLEVFDEAMSR